MQPWWTGNGRHCRRWAAGRSYTWQYPPQLRVRQSPPATKVRRGPRKLHQRSAKNVLYGGILANFSHCRTCPRIKVRESASDLGGSARSPMESAEPQRTLLSPSRRTRRRTPPESARSPMESARTKICPGYCRIRMIQVKRAFSSWARNGVPKYWTSKGTFRKRASSLSPFRVSGPSLQFLCHVAGLCTPFWIFLHKSKISERGRGWGKIPQLSCPSFTISSPSFLQQAGQAPSPLPFGVE